MVQYSVYLPAASLRVTLICAPAATPPLEYTTAPPRCLMLKLWRSCPRFVTLKVTDPCGAVAEDNVMKLSRRLTDRDVAAQAWAASTMHAKAKVNAMLSFPSTEPPQVDCLVERVYGTLPPPVFLPRPVGRRRKPPSLVNEATPAGLSLDQPARGRSAQATPYPRFAGSAAQVRAVTAGF